MSGALNRECALHLAPNRLRLRVRRTGRRRDCVQSPAECQIQTCACRRRCSHQCNLGQPTVVSDTADNRLVPELQGAESSLPSRSTLVLRHERVKLKRLEATSMTGQERQGTGTLRTHGREKQLACVSISRVVSAAIALIPARCRPRGIPRRSFSSPQFAPPADSIDSHRGGGPSTGSLARYPAFSLLHLTACIIRIERPQSGHEESPRWSKDRQQWPRMCCVTSAPQPAPLYFTNQRLNRSKGVVDHEIPN